MPIDETRELLARNGIDEDTLVKMTGLTKRSARAYLSGEKHIPEPARRLILILLGEAKAEDYR